MMLYYIYISIVAISFLSSLLSFRLDYPFHLKLFSILLGLTLFTEICAKFLLNWFQLRSNYPIYNIYILVQDCFYPIYFMYLISNSIARKVTKLFFILFPMFWIVTTFFILGINAWNSYAIMFGDIFLVYFSVVYLYELFVSEKLVKLHLSPEFWIATASVIYFSSELPLTGMLNYLAKNYPEQTLMLSKILQLLNIIMYSIFIYAYLCQVKIHTSKYRLQ
jgi:hypothetical protein